MANQSGVEWAAALLFEDELRPGVGVGHAGRNLNDYASGLEYPLRLAPNADLHDVG